MAVITITREYGTSSKKIIAQVAQKLGYDYIGEELQQKIAEELKLSESEVELFRKASQSRLIRMMDRYTCSLVQKIVDRDKGCLDEKDYHDAMIKLVEKLYQADNVIIIDWGSQCILRGKPNTMHVRLTREQEEQIRMVMDASSTKGYAAAKQVIEKQTRDTAFYIKQYFNVEWDDPQLYDLIIDMGQTTEERAVEMICERVSQMETAKA